MKSKWNKLLALSLTAAMVVAAMSGCAAKPEEDKPADPSSTGGDTTPKVETNADREKVSIRFSQFGNSTDDPDGMKNDPIKKAIEEAVNVSLSYESGTDNYEENIATQLAVGDAPDLFPSWGQTDKISKWAADEAVTEIGSIVAANPDRYPTLTKLFSDETYKAYNQLYTGDADKVYAIYSLAAMAKPSFAGVPVYSKKILDEVNGGKIPATVDEFIAFTKACAAKGYVGWWPRNSKLSDWNEIDKTIAVPQGTSIQPPKGDAWSGFLPTAEDADVWKLMTTSDKSKEVVKQLADMYSAKGLDNGIGVKDDFTDAKAAFTINKIGAVNFGFGYAAQFKDLYFSDWVKANPDTAKPEDIVQGVALTGSAGTSKTHSTFTWVNSHYFIPSSCKSPERVLDLVEFLASQPGQDILFNAKNGQFDTSKNSDDWNAINKAYGYGEDGRCKYVWTTYMFSGTEYMTEFASKGWYDSVTNPVDFSENWMTAEEKAVQKTAQDVIDTFVGDVAVKLPGYYNMVAYKEDINVIRTSLTEITNRYLPQMIGGQMDIEKEWPNYVKEYETAGAAKLETALNEAIVTAKAAG